MPASPPSVASRLLDRALGLAGPAGWIGVGLVFGALLAFFRRYRDQLVALVGQHLLVVGLALPVAAVLGVLLAIPLRGRPRAAAVVLGVAGVLTTVPSIALFGLMIPVLAPLGWGVGVPPAVIALVGYSILPILRNSLVGLEGVPAGTLEAARGMGLSPSQILWRVQLPLAAPVVLAGVRTAVVMGVGVTAIAAYVGAGGLGRWVFGGIRRSYPEMTLAGAVSIAALAIIADRLLARLEGAFGPRGGEQAA